MFGLLILAYQGFLTNGTTTESVTTRCCGSLAQVSQELWSNDVNRLSISDITLNYQSQVPDNTKTDHASQKFFTRVNEAKLSGSTFQSFLSLLDNYDPDKGDEESLTTEELNENDAFLEAILGTRVMNILLNHLICTGIIDNQAQLRSVLTKIWFDFYPRSGSNTVNDTSGFEHVMVGEYKSTRKVNGFHNWLSFYQKEKAGQVDYFGYVAKTEPSIIGAAFKWNNRVKTLGSFFVGVSPEFDIAIYTLCFLTYPNRKCPVVLNGHALNIQSYGKNGHIATIYLEF